MDLEILQWRCKISWVIERKGYLKRIRAGLKRSPIVALLGPRQCGKTTLARQILAADAPNYFDLEDPAVAALFEQPMTVLQPLRGLVVIDEAQRQPGLYPVLRVLADRAERPATFLILGSASPELSRQASESLAGRVEIIELRGFDGGELPVAELGALWLRGGFPRSYLARTDADSLQWRRDFVRTFLERDLAGLGFGMAPAALGRFWTMISHYHGQIWNGSEVAASLGIAPNTARSHLDALEQTFMVRRLPPWHANLGKRLVKTPKIYFRDSGLFHALQGIATAEALHTHPKLGASWEGFALEETLQAVEPEEAYFYAVHGAAELDLFMIKGGRRIGVEFKREDAPRLTHSMHVALTDLKLDRLSVIYPGARRYRLNDKVEVLPLRDVVDAERITGE
jgi:predicted AAA+ superfamily ATPase